MTKRGLSSIISTVLIVLIALVAVALVWNFFQNSLTQSGENIGSEARLSGTRFSVIPETVSNTNEDISFALERNSGGGDEPISAVVVLEDDLGNIASVDYSETDWSVLQRVIIDIPQATHNLPGSVVKIEIHSSIRTDNGDIVTSRNPVETYTFVGAGGGGQQGGTQFDLVVNIVGQGSVVPLGGTYDDGTQVILTATPNAGWGFDSWSGDATGTSNPITITMNANKTVTATFVQTPTAIPVTTCGTLDQAGATYELQNDITLTTEGINCFNIVANDITFDGKQHTINGGTGNNQPGIQAIGVSNIVIKDFKLIQRFGYGVYFSGVSGSTIKDIKTSLDGKGVGLVGGSTNNLVTNLTSNSETFGVEIDGSSTNTISDSQITGNSRGISFVNGDSNVITNNNVMGLDNTDLYGVYLSTGSTGNVFNTNTICGVVLVSHLSCSANSNPNTDNGNVFTTDGSTAGTPCTWVSPTHPVCP